MGIERTFVGLPSPVVGRAGAGGHPCQGIDPVALARLCQRAEHRARGVPTGLLDQLAVIGGVVGHGLLLDCTALTMTPVPLPPPSEAEWLVIHAGARSLAQSGYTDRVNELATAEAAIDRSDSPAAGWPQQAFVQTPGHVGLSSARRLSKTRPARSTT